MTIITFILEVLSEDKNDWVLIRYSYSADSYRVYKILQEIWEYEKGIPCRLVVTKALI